MDKDDRLLALVDQLCSDLDFEISVVDHWDADLVATGIAHPDDERTFVYLSLWGGGISYQCEPAPTSTDAIDDSDGIVNDASYADLLAATIRHLTPRSRAEA